MAVGTRVLVVARRFWPISDDGSLRLLHHCSSMAERGFQISLLTARWHPTWPAHSLCKNLSIHRVLPPPTSSWNETHFQKNVLAWISKSIDEYDVIYVDRSDGLLAAIAARAAKWKKPVIGRFSPEDPTSGIPNSQLVSLTAAIEACRRCNYVITPTNINQRLLISQGIPASKIVQIPDVAWATFDRRSDARAHAAMALFDANSDLVVPNRTEILLHHGRATLQSLRPVVEGMCDLLDEGAELRLWIVGSSSHPESIHELIKGRGWHREILIFDAFDDIQELLTVADLAIVSNPVESLQYTLPHCIEACLPCIVADTRESREYVPVEYHRKLFSNTASFVKLVRDWQLYQGDWDEEAVALRRSFSKMALSDTNALAWQSLIHNLSSEVST